MTKREIKFFSIFGNQEKLMILNYLRNCLVRSGSSGLDIKGRRIRLFAFWDKSGDKSTLVITTHGLIKKTLKTPKKEIDKAEKLRKDYFNL
jgi:hypothetical protein